jgi:hypothetical protein
MDIASLRAKLDNIAEELAQLPEQDTVAIEEETIEEAHMMPKTLKCKECGDMLGNPTTDCPCDSMDPKGDNWIMIDVDNDGDMDMAMANEEEVEEGFAVGATVAPEEEGPDQAPGKVIAVDGDKVTVKFMDGSTEVFAQDELFALPAGLKVGEEKEIEEESFNVAMAKLKKKEKAAGVSDDFYGKADQDYDALIKAYDSKSEREQLGMMDPDKLDDPTTKIPQTPKKKMAKLDDPTTKLPQVAEEEATVNIPVQELADIMQLAGYKNYAERIEEYVNEPDEDYSDTEDQLIGLSGGLNGPKNMHTPAAGGDNPMDKEALKTVEESLYKSYKAFLEEAELTEKE